MKERVSDQHARLGEDNTMSRRKTRHAIRKTRHAIRKLVSSANHPRQNQLDKSCSSTGAPSMLGPDVQ